MKLILFFIAVFALPTLAVSDTASSSSKLKNRQIISLIQNINKKNLIANNVSKVDAEYLGIPNGEELILGIKVGDFYLGDIFAYKSQENARLGFINTIETLDFPIEIDLENKTAKGWFISEENSFELTFPSEKEKFGKAIVKGKTFLFSKESFDIQADDVFIEAKQIATWFDFTFTFNFSDLTINLDSKQSLPIINQTKRRKQKTVSTINNKPVLPWKESAYKAISAPLYDVQLFSTKSDSSSAISGYSIVGSQDIAYLNTEYFLSGTSENSLNNVRVKFERDLSEDNIFGIGHYEFGDITPIKSGVESTGNLSRGFSVSSDVSGKRTDYNTTNLNGNIQPDWDVELYRNGVFIKRQTTGLEGRYEFNDIGLLFGNNNLELIFYGPQGQVQKKTEQIVIAGNALKKNESSYSASVTELNKSLINVSRTDSTQAEGWLISGKYSKGITDWFSAYVGQSYFLNANSDEENSQIYNMGSNLTLFDTLLLSGNLDINNNHQKALNFSARSFLGNHSINIGYSYTFAGDVKKDNTNISAVDTWSSNVVMAGPLLNYKNYELQYQNRILHTETGDLSKLTSISNSLSLNSGASSISNSLFWQNIESSGISNEIATGSLSINKYFGRIGTRFSTNYSIKPETKVEQYISDLNWLISDNLQSNLSLSYTPGINYYRAKLGLSWHNDVFNIASSASYDKNDNWRIGLNINFSLGYDPMRDQMFMSRQKMSGSGAIMARVFEDSNANGRFDKGEALLEGVKVEGVQNFRRGISNDKGLAVISGMSANQTSDIRIDEGTLPDAFMVQMTEGSSITARKGYLEYLDFPIVVSSELDGTVYIKSKEGEEKAAAFIGINLINEQGEVVAKTSTEYDGYYYFGSLLPGKYNVTIAKSDIVRKKLRKNKDILLSFNQGDVINGSDISLSELEFTQGYVVNAGVFNNLDMLKTYWVLIKKRYRRIHKDRVFFIENKDTHKFQLNLGFYKTEAEANTACLSISNMKINCSNEEFEFGF